MRGAAPSASAARGAAWDSSISPTSLVGEADEILDVLQEPNRCRDWIGTVGIGVLATGDRIPGRAGDGGDGGRHRRFSRVFGPRAAEGQRQLRRGARRPGGARRRRAGRRHVGQGRQRLLVGGVSSSRSRTVQIANAVLRAGSPARRSRPEVGGRDAPHAGLRPYPGAFPRHRMRGQHHRHAGRPARRSKCCSRWSETKRCSSWSACPCRERARRSPATTPRATWSASTRGAG